MSLGEKFREEFFFRTITGSIANITGMNPVLVFLPKSKPGAWGYDLEVADPATGYGFVDVEGVLSNDKNGYRCELYSRDENGHPTELLAVGEVAMTGSAYAYEGPLGPMTLPVGPEGPPGPPGPAGIAGPTGIRGSIWFTADTPPDHPGNVVGDMWLDTATGNVYRWQDPLDGGEALWVRFTGAPA